MRLRLRARPPQIKMLLLNWLLGLRCRIVGDNKLANLHPSGVVRKEGVVAPRAQVTRLVLDVHSLLLRRTGGQRNTNGPLSYSVVVTAGPVPVATSPIKGLFGDYLGLLRVARGNGRVAELVFRVIKALGRCQLLLSQLCRCVLALVCLLKVTSVRLVSASPHCPLGWGSTNCVVGRLRIPV